ncbi:hypothetical protein [Propionibacterium freudenreichii]|uniref:hypothetical protein n=1 Tax=Propionibacterium freudenreichii TaxID=1744 RepID=UPI0022FD4810|nr:hypothetical protein [Propionibacterium freudenreichii]MDK9661644.1 hypothetical protein [Propionibacterium freudenreichii]
MKRIPVAIVGCAVALVAGSAVAGSAARAARLDAVARPSLSASVDVSASGVGGAEQSAGQASPGGSTPAVSSPAASAPAGEPSRARGAAAQQPEATASSQPGSGTTDAPAQTGITTIPAAVAASPTGALTDQVVAVVASGSSAQVHLLNRRAAGSWDDEWVQSGFVGAGGVGRAHEGSSVTPAGSWPLGPAFGTGADPGTLLPYTQLNAGSCWVSDPGDPDYNSYAERDACDVPNLRMADFSEQYRYGLVIGQNAERAPGAGSASFVHVSNGAAGAASVALPQSAMASLLHEVHPGAHIVIASSIEELATY